MSKRSASRPSNTQGHKGSIFIDGQKYPLPEQVLRNIETIIDLQANQERKIPWHEKLLAKVAAAFGRPQFLYAQLLLFVVWSLISYVAGGTLDRWNLPALDIEEQGIDIAALLISTGVLVRQAQQDKIAEQRSHLMLQINLLNEQKIAKVIGLIEELRTDIPDVKNRSDWEADIMGESTDPQVVLNILQENLEHAGEEAE